MVLPGVEVIPDRTFMNCDNLETIIMADTVKRIEERAFYYCRIVVFVKLSRNLEYIGRNVFDCCYSLSSIFIPPSCRQIDNFSFRSCSELIIFTVPRHTQLGSCVIVCTALYKASPFETVLMGHYINLENVNDWIKNQNMALECVLHRACSSYNPMHEIVYGIVKRKGLQAFHLQNAIGIMPLQYLEANPFAEIDQKRIIAQYILEMMGEAV